MIDLFLQFLLGYSVLLYALTEVRGMRNMNFFWAFIGAFIWPIALLMVLLETDEVPPSGPCGPSGVKP